MTRRLLDTWRATDTAPLAAPGALAMAARAMVVAPHRWAAIAGVDVLREGGSAVDAAVAVGAALMVAYPQHSGLGGDGFWLIRERGRPTVALNASGRAPRAADAEQLRRAGHHEIPPRSAYAVTVPGVVDGWRAVHERYGRLPLDRLLAWAVEGARQGVAVTPLLAGALADAGGVLRARSESRRVYGDVGAVLVQADLARTLEVVAEDPRAFYEGPLAEAVAGAVQDEGGWVSAQDLAAHRSEWTQPVSAPFAGWTVEEMPPNSQGVAALVGLRELERGGLPDANDDDAWLGRAVQAARVLMAVRDAEVADPAAMRRPVRELLGGDTVHFCVADEDGTVVSCMQSLFSGFGSGIVVPGTGILLHNRGRGFSLEADRPSVLTAGLRPLHTLAPAMATTTGGDVVALGCMGGHAQAQIHVQLLAAMAGRRHDPATAVAAARWAVEGAVVRAEDRDGLPARLERLGHHVLRDEPYAQALGHAQVLVAGDGLAGAADPRSDGAALGY